MLKIPKYCKIKLIMPRIKFFIITLFPDALRPYLDSSMLYKAQDRGIIEIEYVNLREFGIGPHRSVDDTPYGGGDGMLMLPLRVLRLKALTQKSSSQLQSARLGIRLSPVNLLVFLKILILKTSRL